MSRGAAAMEKFGEMIENLRKLREFVSLSELYDELPLFLNAAMVAKVLGIAPSSSYELMHGKEFPALRIGNRIVVPKEAFIRWVE